MTRWGYGRTSIGGDDGSNPENQRRSITMNGVEERYIYIDEGSSGTTRASDRREWQILRSRIESGDVIVVAALDRLGRTIGNTCDLVADLHREGVVVETLADGQKWLNPYLAADRESPEGAMGAMFLSIFGMVGAMERDAIARRTREGLARARAEGKQIGGQNRISDVVREAVIADRRDGLSWSQLQSKYRIGRSTARRIIKEANIVNNNNDSNGDD